MDKISEPFWNIAEKELLQHLNTTLQGLTEQEAQQRIREFSIDQLQPQKESTTLLLFLAQFKSSITVILLFTAVLSFFLRDSTDAIIILSIIFISGFLGFWQERGAANAVKDLLSIVQTTAQVWRNGTIETIPIDKVVPGDIVMISAGGSVPADCRILESKDLFVDEATLTGETYPVEKAVGVLPAETPLIRRTNSLFLGTHVVSGMAKVLAVQTGRKTEFGKVSDRLKLRPPETEFQRGVRRFGYFLMEITLLLVIAIFSINIYLARPVMDSFLFSLALAVGLTPQLLPAIISVNLSHGAKRMAGAKVIVKRLSSIEDFGSMNVLCSDKTGTITEGVVKLHAAIDVDGNESEKVRLYAFINAFYESGFVNPIDAMLRTGSHFDMSGYHKLNELPYDFIRKRLSIVVSKDDTNYIVTKGALQNVLSVYTKAETPGATIVEIAEVQEKIVKRYEEFGGKGFRVLGIACRSMSSEATLEENIEQNMTFLGMLVFSDPPKSGIAETINDLNKLGVGLKVITGDNRMVATHVGGQIGLMNQQILTGPELRQMSDEALIKRVNEVDIFAEVEPNQKERIIIALKKSGNVVGYMGDGINDASALHAADVGISVDSAIDVAKEAADIVLLEKNLHVLLRGVSEGRITFANTLKYVFMATSANFVNMFSMAGASLFLPFLPLLPKQILLTNLITDFPEMTIATDSVDDEMIRQPRRWNIRFIQKFMLTFGLISSVFDYLTFGVLLFILHATTDQFRTGWFLESVISASLIVIVIRTRKPFIASKPGKYLVMATMIVMAVILILPYTAPHFSTLRSCLVIFFCGWG
ncbi:MAG: magnesium-translocating P-type ATPase [Deltaproteobacteria bacterium]|nr:magnesium-translocating P-type ATPase [Deltaproteobacteria bacterium]